MITAAADQPVAIPPAAAFALVSDVAGWAEWLPLHRGWPDGPPTDVVEGARFRQELGIFGFRDTVTFTVTEYDGRSVIAVRGTGSFGSDAEISFLVVPDGPGSLIHAEIAIIGKLARPLAVGVRAGLNAALAQSLGKLADRVETT